MVNTVCQDELMEMTLLGSTQFRLPQRPAGYILPIEGGDVDRLLPSGLLAFNMSFQWS